MSFYKILSPINRAAILLLCCYLSFPVPLAWADINVTIGPTEIPRGDAVGGKDITVNNGVFAVAFAVDSAPPWGVARGGIIDIALIHNGVVGHDIASLADFAPDSWNDWPTSYQDVTIEKQTPSEVVIRTRRDWHTVELDTTYTIRDGDSKIHLMTSMTNNGEESFNSLKSGYVSWPDGGHLLSGSLKPNNDEPQATSEKIDNSVWTAAYDKNWVIGLHAEFAELTEYEGRDKYHAHDLKPGSSRSFQAWLQIENTGSLSPLIETDIKLRNLEYGVLKGSVASKAETTVNEPAVIIHKGKQLYGWTLVEKGKFEMFLPVGEYALYATAKGHAQGRTKHLNISKNKTTRVDFADIQPPGTVTFHVREAHTTKALDARITIASGPSSDIGFFGRSTFFTKLDSMGRLKTEISPGQYEFAISAGGEFTSATQVISARVESGKTIELDVDIPRLADPRDSGWYSADLHHHSDVLDGFSDAEYVLRSQLASGVDIAFLSDHDSIINNGQMQKLSDRRDVLFMHGIELSPAWAHFNAFPLDHDKQLSIEPGRSTVQEIFAEARRMGADFVEVNHGFRPYGYFSSHKNGSVPGGFNDNFQLVEVEAPYFEGFADRNLMAAQHMWQLWNDGKKVYLATGSDVHDVWNEPSGSARTYVHIDGELSIEKYVAGLKAGQAYASMGPLIFPEILFGSEITLKKGDELNLKYALQSVTGLANAQLIVNGTLLEDKHFDGNTAKVSVHFSLTAKTNGWASLIVNDVNGKTAYSNPVWITVNDN